MHLRSCTLMSGVTLLALATGAQAELAAETVWDDWRSYAESSGQTVTAQQSREGDRLVLSGVTIATADPEGGNATILLDRIVLTERPDGTVGIDLPTVAPVTFAREDSNGGSFRVSMDFRQSGLGIVATGTETAIDYSYTAETMALETTGIESNGRLMPAQDNAVAFTVDGLSGTSTSRYGAETRYTQDFGLDALRYRMLATGEIYGSRVEITGQTRDLAIAGESVLPEGVAPTGDIFAMAAAGMLGSGSFSWATNAMSLLATDAGGTTETSLISQAGSADVTAAQNGVSYTLLQSDVKAEINHPQSAVPLRFDLARTVLDVALPLDSGDFSLGLDLGGVTLSDALWGLLDPQGQIPRDPASLLLDLAGRGSLVPDASDPVPEMPEVETVDIRQLRIAAAGAEIEGRGAFAFDTTADEPQRPQGAMDLTLMGGNALIDSLIAAGIVPEQQATGLRMMLAMFAAPGEGSDTLTSRIEINDQGHVLVNGQRIQ